MPKPIMIFDGDCSFCRFWAGHGQKWTGSHVLWRPYQDVLNQFPQISQKEFQEAIHYVDANGTVFVGSEAVFRGLSNGDSIPLWIFENVPGFSIFAEYGYKIVVRHRSVLLKCIKFFR